MTLFHLHPTAFLDDKEHSEDRIFTTQDQWIIPKVMTGRDKPKSGDIRSECQLEAVISNKQLKLNHCDYPFRDEETPKEFFQRHFPLLDFSYFSYCLFDMVTAILMDTKLAQHSINFPHPDSGVSYHLHMDNSKLLFDLELSNLRGMVDGDEIVLPGTLTACFQFITRDVNTEVLCLDIRVSNTLLRDLFSTTNIPVKVIKAILPFASLQEELLDTIRFYNHDIDVMIAAADAFNACAATKALQQVPFEAKEVTNISKYLSNHFGGFKLSTLLTSDHLKKLIGQRDDVLRLLSELRSAYWEQTQEPPHTPTSTTSVSTNRYLQRSLSSGSNNSVTTTLSPTASDTTATTSTTLGSP